MLAKLRGKLRSGDDRHRGSLVAGTASIKIEIPAASQAGTPTNAAADERRTEALDFASQTNWSDLGLPATPLLIAKTAEGGLQLDQLRKIYGHIKRRLKKERHWRCTPPPDFKPMPITRPEMVNLYDTAKYVILPATVSSECSMVELMTLNALLQRPRWFVSHWCAHGTCTPFACHACAAPELSALFPSSSGGGSPSPTSSRVSKRIRRTASLCTRTHTGSVPTPIISGGSTTR
jgi:hypothetical protein